MSEENLERKTCKKHPFHVVYYGDSCLLCEDSKEKVKK